MKPDISPQAAELRRRAEAELRTLHAGQKSLPMMAELCRRSEARLRKWQRNQRLAVGIRSQRPIPSGCSTNCRCTRSNWRCRTRSFRRPGIDGDPAGEIHRPLRFRAGGLFLLDEQGRILEVNLTGAACLAWNGRGSSTGSCRVSWFRRASRSFWPSWNESSPGPGKRSARRHY